MNLRPRPKNTPADFASKSEKFELYESLLVASEINTLFSEFNMLNLNKFIYVLK